MSDHLHGPLTLGICLTVFAVLHSSQHAPGETNIVSGFKGFVLCRRGEAAPMVLDEAELPGVLREALREARQRVADRRARRARASSDEEGSDEEGEVGPPGEGSLFLSARDLEQK